MPRLKERLNQFRLERKFCDIEVFPGDSTAGFKCHKLVLMAASDYFACMFNSGMRESSANSITLGDCSTEVLSLMIEFIYQEERPTGITCDNVLELFSWAIRCDLEGLSEYCWQFLQTTLGPENVFCVLAFANAHHLRKIQKYCIQLIQRQFQYLCTAPEWLELSNTTMRDILSYQMLRVFHEDTVLQILLKWVPLHPEHSDILDTIRVDNLSNEVRLKHQDVLNSIQDRTGNELERRIALHVHLMVQLKDDPAILMILCVTNSGVTKFRYPEMNFSEFERKDDYRIVCCNPQAEGTAVGLCKNKKVFIYNNNFRRVIFKENRNAEFEIVDMAMFRDVIYMILELPHGLELNMYAMYGTTNVVNLPRTAHKILQNSRSIFILGEHGSIHRLNVTDIRYPTSYQLLELCASSGMEECEGACLESGQIIVHGVGSSGEYATFCLNESSPVKVPTHVKLYHDISQEDEVIVNYQLIAEDSEVYLIEECMSENIAIYKWDFLKGEWNIVKVFKEPQTQFVCPMYRNRCDATQD